MRVSVLAEKDGCPLGLEETVTRELFESLIAGDLTRTRRPVNVCVSDSGLHEGDLDMVPSRRRFHPDSCLSAGNPRAAGD